MSGIARARVRQLLADRAAVGLDDRAAIELAGLCERFPALRALDDSSFDLAAAAVGLALDRERRPPERPLPAGLRNKLLTDAAGHFRSSPGGNS